MNYKVQGSRGILVRLDKYESDKVTESGIIVPKFKNYETDGGRPASKIDDGEVFSSTGTIVQVSDKCQQLLSEEKMDLGEGDRVMIDPNAKSPHNWFIENRSVKVADFEGLVLLHPNHIQAKIVNNG